MNKNGPILLIDDDIEDLEIFTDILIDITSSHEVMPFTSSDAALTFLNDNPSLKPFLILSDINLPKITGIELRDKIHNNEQIRLRCIPYLFFTSSASHKDVIDAYSKSIQGFFVKPANLKELKVILETIINYWNYCTAPNIATEQSYRHVK